MQTYLFTPLYHAYIKARKKKKPSFNQLAFEGRLLDNLSQLSHKIISQTWRPSPYLSFVALKPKARQTDNQTKQYLPCQTDKPSPQASHDLPLITQQPHLQQEKCHAKTTDHQTVQPCFDFGNECS